MTATSTGTFAFPTGSYGHVGESPWRRRRSGSGSGGGTLTRAAARVMPHPAISLSIATVAVIYFVWQRTIARVPWMNPDNYSMLAWAHQLANGNTLSIDRGFATPHPLPLSLLVPLDLLGWEPLTIFGRLFGLSMAVIVAGTAIAAYRRAGAIGAGIALAVVALAPSLWDTMAFRSIDLMAAAFVAAALAVPPRSRDLRLYLLIAAGLVRPEVWLLPGLVVLLEPTPWRHNLRRIVGFGVAAPVLWMAFDWITTGSPMRSVNRTDELAAYKQTAIPFLQIPTTFGTESLAALGVVAAPVAFVLAARTLRRAFRHRAGTDAVAAIVLVGVPLVILAEMLHGYPLRTRYLLVLLPAAAVEIAAVALYMTATGPRRESIAAGALLLAVVSVAIAQDHRRYYHHRLSPFYTSSAEMIQTHAKPCAIVGVTGERARLISLFPPIAVMSRHDIGQFEPVRPGAPLPARQPDIVVTRSPSDLQLLGQGSRKRYRLVETRPVVQLWALKTSTCVNG